MDYWAKSPIRRRQVVLFGPTLDDWIAEDHPVRLFDEVLGRCDWSSWESRYSGRIGQPPIHPRVLASALLWGLSLGVRSSRRLERACGNSIDFIWLLHGEQIDHSTFCEFRNKFETDLKDLFRQIGRIAMGMGLVNLNRVSLDGTRVRANSSRHRTASAKKIEARLVELDRQIEELFAEANQADRKEDQQYGEGHTPNRLPGRIAKAEARRQCLQKALEKAREKQKDAKSDDKPPRVPVADPESNVMPNKDGGHAPNYTPVATVDAEAGLIVDADVNDQPVEAHMMTPSIKRIEERFERKPKQMVADMHFGTGKNLSDLEAMDVEAFIPMEHRNDTGENPAPRDEVSRPVCQQDWPRLPRNSKDKLDKSAFIYDAEADCYWCPMGRKLEHWRTTTRQSANGSVQALQYRSVDCAGCALRADCTGGPGKRRTVLRDEYEQLRKAMDARLATEEGKAAVAQRMSLSETPFGVIKSIMGLRQFLTRGLRKVKTEWLWACTAYNLKRIVCEVEVRNLSISATGG